MDMIREVNKFVRNWKIKQSLAQHRQYPENNRENCHLKTILNTVQIIQFQFYIIFTQCSPGLSNLNFQQILDFSIDFSEGGEMSYSQEHCSVHCTAALFTLGA